MSASDWPIPTVSTIGTSKISDSTRATWKVVGASPPSAVAEAWLRKKIRPSAGSRFIRVRSPH